MKQADLTVIIPSWNRVELLAHCLASLDVQTVPCRVIVVDNGSTDRTGEILQNRFPGVQCIRLEKNLGFARAVNIGIEAARTPLLALLNNDTEADPSWIEAGLNGFDRYPDYAFFASRIIDFYDRTRLDSAGDSYGRTGLPTKRGFGAPTDAYITPEPVAGASAGAAFYRSELFRRVGLFDESYYLYLEDVEFSLRARTAGFPCLYLPQAVVYHIEGASDPERRTSSKDRQRGIYSARRVYWITRNRWQLMVTYQPMSHIPWLAAGWIRSLAFHTLKAGYLGPFLKGLWDGIGRTQRALRRRRQLELIRKVSNRELWNTPREF